MDNRSADPRAMGAIAGMALAMLYALNRFGDILDRSADPLRALSGRAFDRFVPEILADPARIGGGTFALLATTLGITGIALVATFAMNQAKARREGEEFGSSRDGKVSEGQAYRDPDDPDNNIILTKHLGIAIRRTPSVREKVANRNVLIIGGSGAGKTAGFVEPNVMQVKAGRDMVVIDPKGTVIERVGATLVRNGIDIRVFDTKDMRRSDLWNPLANIKSYDDILTFIECLVTNTNNGRESSDPIWDNGERLFYQALLTLMWDWGEEADMTMKRLLELTTLADIGGDGNEGQKCPLDRIFDQIETGRKPRRSQGSSGPRSARGVASRGTQMEPTKMKRRDGVSPAEQRRGSDGRMRYGLDVTEDPALSAWHQFRHGAGKTLQSFVISSHTRLASLQQEGVKTLLSGKSRGRDDMHLELLGQDRMPDGSKRPPRVIFVVMSDFDGHLNCLLSLFMWQAIFLPMSAADNRNGSLPRPVSLVFDEFKNVGKLPSFSQSIAVVRSRNIDIQIILQSLSQLKSTYGEEDALTIRDCCATTLFLGGGRNFSTAKEISEMAGKQTIEKTSSSVRGFGPGADHTVSHDVIGRDLYDPAEVSTLSNKEALVFIGDKQIIKDDKSWCYEHPRYDPVYQGEHPDRAFDYLAWKEAGRPLGEEAITWLMGWEAGLDVREARDALDGAAKAVDEALDERLASVTAADAASGTPEYKALKKEADGALKALDAARRRHADCERRLGEAEEAFKSTTERVAELRAASAERRARVERAKTHRKDHKRKGGDADGLGDAP